MNDTHAATISLIERQFLQLVPASRFQFALPSSATSAEIKYDAVCDLEVQQEVYSRVLEPAEGRGIAPAYIVAIVKAMVAVIENAGEEVDGDVFMLMINLLRHPTPPVPPPGPVTYKFLDTSITITETRNLISGYGTTGFRTWEASLALGEYIISQHLLPSTSPDRALDLSSKRVLELGAGTGFASILCAKLGSRLAVATDGFEEVVLRMRGILESNQVEELVETRVYKWGNSSGIETGSVLEKESREEEYVYNEPVDLILGADITFDAEGCNLLVSSFDQLERQNPSVQILISATIRNEETIAAFETYLAEKNFAFTVIPANPHPKWFFYDAVPEIRIYSLYRATK
ncbi:hypothetical protein BZA70DRAFT_86346 [Myxozyma melibiosi]|uniref:Uncharacterized protein n=1 Tax=Myxozyma melibiosi TaxID=54550 RepID=A0ABR1EZE6_9ASCO